MAITASKKNSTIMSGQTYESFKNGDSGLSKFFKRIQPVTLNTMDPQQQQQEQQELPILLLHELNSLLTPGIESPLVAIYHQLEITFNFGLHQEEIRAKIPVLVSSVPSSTVQENKKTRKKKYEIENQLHTCPFSTELIDTSSTKDTLYYHTLNDNSSTITQVSSSSSSSDTNCSLLKKTVSDQNLKPKDIQRTGSMTPPSPTNRPKMLDTQLANTLKSSITTPMTSPMTPNKFIDYSQPLTDATAFTGLPPPPRRARKKESIQEDFSNRRTITTRHSRPNSPTISLHTPPPYSYEKYNNHQQQQDTWMGVVPTASSSSRTTTVRLLNQSKSSGTSSTSSNSRIQQKRRSNSIDYSKLVKNHYVCAELPPIPPPITRQRLPSIPTAAEEKEEHRKTRMYYEDESDEEEDEAEIYNFFLQQL
ncbi:hypothetical protein BD770DRAFT_67807 [Pilaira anomala]|nr:hypothetical protein BD770DRAFT_67807 [Pilaira anomala]